MTKGIKMMLEALGIGIDPEEIEQVFNRIKTDLPKVAEFLGQKFESIDTRLGAIEAKLDDLQKSAGRFGMEKSEIKQIVNGHASSGGVPNA